MVAAVIASAGLVLLILRQEAPQVEVLADNIELYFYVDEAGNASCQYVGRVLDPKLENLIKQSILLMGTTKAEQTYIESLRREYGRYGIEIKNPVCEITGLAPGENLTLTMTWQIPSLARMNENGWIISLDWINAQEAARETIAEVESQWVSYRNIARYLGVPDANFSTSAKFYLVLPENAENVVCPLAGSSYHVDYGGGSWGEYSLYTELVGGRFAVVENSQNLIATKNEFTITLEQTLENYLAYTVSYDRAYPENLTFVNSVNQVRLDLKYGRNPGEQYLIVDGESEYSLSPAQVLYYAADAIVTMNQGEEFSISQPLVSVTSPASENGEWGVVWENLFKDDYVALAQTVRDEIENTHVAPGMVETPTGFNIRFRDALYTFVRILAAYEESGALPTELLFAPVPTDNLALNGGEIPASYAYYLLGDTLVITGTDRVNGVLDNVRQPDYDNRGLASSLCDWTHGNITYSLMFSPPTSEEVLSTHYGQCRDYANVYLALTRTAGIPARRVNGWVVSTWSPPTGIWEIAVGTTPDGKPIAGHGWTQVFINGGWVPVDPTWGWFENPAYEIYKQTEQSWGGALAGYETGYGVL